MSIRHRVISIWEYQDIWSLDKTKDESLRILPNFRPDRTKQNSNIDSLGLYKIKIMSNKIHEQINKISQPFPTKNISFGQH